MSAPPSAGYPLKQGTILLWPRLWLGSIITQYDYEMLGVPHTRGGGFGKGRGNLYGGGYGRGPQEGRGTLPMQGKFTGNGFGYGSGNYRGDGECD